MEMNYHKFIVLETFKMSQNNFLQMAALGRFYYNFKAADIRLFPPRKNPAIQYTAASCTGSEDLFKHKYGSSQLCVSLSSLTIIFTQCSFLRRRKRFSVALQNYGVIIQGIEYPVYFNKRYRHSASGKKSFRLQIWIQE